MGLVDGALESAGETRMVAMLREAMAVIGQDATLASIGVTTDETACVTVIEARLLPHAVGPRSWRRSVRLAPASDYHRCHPRGGSTRLISRNRVVTTAVTPLGRLCTS